MKLKTKPIAADGKWHNVFENSLTGLKAFEIIASAKGEQSEGRYCLLHAVAVSTFGNSRSKISKTCAYYGKWWNNISIRWESRVNAIETPENEKWWHNLPLIRGQIKGKKQPREYNLQMRTKSNYGDDKFIAVKISKRYDENLDTDNEMS